jgi:hypothetical protein
MNRLVDSRVRATVLAILLLGVGARDVGVATTLALAACGATGACACRTEAM